MTISQRRVVSFSRDDNEMQPFVDKKKSRVGSLQPPGTVFFCQSEKLKTNTKEIIK